MWGILEKFMSEAGIDEKQPPETAILRKDSGKQVRRFYRVCGRKARQSLGLVENLPGAEGKFFRQSCGIHKAMISRWGRFPMFRIPDCIFLGALCQICQSFLSVISLVHS